MAKTIFQNNTSQSFMRIRLSLKKKSSKTSKDKRMKKGDCKIKLEVMPNMLRKCTGPQLVNKRGKRWTNKYRKFIIK